MLCNGRSELCDRKYGNVTFLGAHDSFAHSPNPFARKCSCASSISATNPPAVSRTQEVPLTEQLNLGARLLQAQSHM